MLTHVHPISETLIGGAWSANIDVNLMELAYVLIIPDTSANDYTFRITSPSSNIIFTAKVAGRLYREVKVPCNGTYTLAVVGATVVADTINGELGFRR